MRIKRICVVADAYPYRESNAMVFVRELVFELAKKGVECSVIVPQMVHPGRKKYIPEYFEDNVDGNITIRVWAPKYTFFSSKIPFMSFSMKSHKKAVLRVIEENQLKPDIMYGHFIYLNGLTVVSIAKELGCKSIIACGENTNRLLKDSKPYSSGLKYCNWKKILKCVDGIVSVSKENRDLLITNGFVDPATSIRVFPNGVNTAVFYQRDRNASRRKLGIKEDDFVIAFVGHFIHRKGPERVDEAICGMTNVKSLFIGKGDFVPKSDCIYCGAVQHDELPEYLSAADVFVLPTTGEGCCNAIIEAISCGLPVISSIGKFNDDILDDSISLRVNPLNVEEIHNAICELYTDKYMLECMRKNTLDYKEKFSLEQRAINILEFMEEVAQ